MTMLDVRTLQASYGTGQVLFDVTFDVGEGECVALLGRNGMGKTTTIKAIVGMLKPSGGSVSFLGQPVVDWPAYRIGQAGIGLVPEGRRIFGTLTLEENLVATAFSSAGRSTWHLDRVFQLFPSLKERRRVLGRYLSGGEQQMLAIGRALMTNPRLLVLDEATEGLAPLIRQEIWRCLQELRAARQSILIVDKHVPQLAEIADQHVILEKGCVVWRGKGKDLLRDQALRDRYLHV
jgi:branched-chain amino acid transport system ATP-binding protein